MKRHDGIANRDRDRITDRRGYAMIAVVVFALVVILMGVTFFALAAGETRGALYRQDSSEAFYLADGAVERARARFLADRTWRDGWTGITAGNGVYDLAVRDTALAGFTSPVVIRATGRVHQAARGIDILADLPLSAFGFSLFIRGDADVGGNLCIDGSVHVAGEADLGPHDVHLACGTYTEGFDLIPPPVYTEGARYPDATYYDVRGVDIGGVEQARIFDRNGVDITTALGDSLADGLVSFDAGANSWTYTFDSAARIARYFDDATGVFRRLAGDAAVVVNFGGPPIGNPAGISNLIIDGDPASTIHATIINTRFTGVTADQRTETRFWTGGLTTVRQVVWEPYHGLAALTHDFQKQGGSLVQLGTTVNPALIYITGDVPTVNSNFVLDGSLVALGDWTSTGGPSITYDEGFLDLLPDYFDEWSPGTSGTLRIISWRETAAGG
jgi:hypothetical protein